MSKDYNSTQCLFYEIVNCCCCYFLYRKITDILITEEQAQGATRYLKRVWGCQSFVLIFLCFVINYRKNGIQKKEGFIAWFFKSGEVKFSYVRKHVHTSYLQMFISYGKSVALGHLKDLICHKILKGVANMLYFFSAFNYVCNRVLCSMKTRTINLINIWS